MRVVLATANPHKAREMIEILARTLDLELLERPVDLDDVEETGATLEENAELKATYVSSATGLAALADDTGLFVDALGGDPGVYSARYAGEHASYADNVVKLLGALEGVAPPRRARFETAAVLVEPNGHMVVTTGAVHGEIATAPRGANGFGYDPIFVPDGGSGRTLAELTDDEKHAISHRGRAFRAMAEALGEQDG
jgi:XTP/dITP diphosphohydrolase